MNTEAVEANTNLSHLEAIWRLRSVDLDYRVRGPCTPMTPEQLGRARPEFLKLDVDEDLYAK